MRKTILLLLVSLQAGFVWAGEATADYLTISNMTVTSGSNTIYSFTVKMKDVSR